MKSEGSRVVGYQTRAVEGATHRPRNWRYCKQSCWWIEETPFFQCNNDDGHNVTDLQEHSKNLGFPVKSMQLSFQSNEETRGAASFDK
jgi:hypothetical protein